MYDFLVDPKGGGFPKGEEAAERAKDLDPRFVPGYIAAGRVQTAKGEINRALAEFNRALELDSKHIQAYYYRGLAYLRDYQFARAERDFDARSRSSRRIRQPSGNGSGP